MFLLLVDFGAGEGQNVVFSLQVLCVLFLFPFLLLLLSLLLLSLLFCFSSFLSFVIYSFAWTLGSFSLHLAGQHWSMVTWHLIWAGLGVHWFYLGHERQKRVLCFCFLPFASVSSFPQQTSTLISAHESCWLVHRGDISFSCLCFFFLFLPYLLLFY